MRFLGLPFLFVLQAGFGSPSTSAPSIPSLAPTASPIVTLSPTFVGQLNTGEEIGNLTSGNARGYSFQAPCSFRIVSFDVKPISSKESSPLPSVVVIRSRFTPFAPFQTPTNLSSTPGADIIFQKYNNPTQIIPADLEILEGDYVGILGYRGSLKETSYGNSSNVVSTICQGAPLKIQRFLPGLELTPGPPFPLVGVEPLNILISRVDFQTVGTYIRTESPSKSPSTSNPTITSLSPSFSPTQVPSLSPVTESPTTLSPITSSPSRSPIESIPSPLQAIIKDSLLGIKLIYSLPFATNIGQCSDILDEATVSLLGISPKCSFFSGLRTLSITFGPEATIVPNSTMRVEYRTTAGRMTGQFKNVTLDPPSNPDLPEVSIVGSSEIGPCDVELYLQVLLAGGAGARNPQTAWRISAESSSLDPDLSAAVSAVSGPILQLDAQIFTPGFYMLHADVTTWVGQAVPQTLRLTVSEKPALEANIPSVSSVTRGEEVKISVRVTSASCVEGSISNELSWIGYWRQIFPSEPFISRSALPYSPDFTNSPVPIPVPTSFVLSVPPQTLNAGETYAFNFQLRLYRGDELSNESNTTFVVQVPVEPVKAVIFGGDGENATITVPSAESPTPTVLVFDASESFDPVDEQFAVSFQWDLRRLSTNELVPMVGSDRRSPVISFKSDLLRATTSYVLSVTVTGKPINGTQRFSTEFKKLVATADDVLVITLGARNVRANPGEKFVIYSVIQSDVAADIQFRWSETTGNDAIINTTRISPNASTLVLPPDVLVAGASYNFRLRASIPRDSLAGQAEFKVTANNPPSFGTCSGSPNISGDALNTLFNLNCTEWVDIDGDYPLRYSFHLLTNFEADSLAKGINLSPSSIRSEISTILPGGGFTNMRVGIVTEIFDSFGASTSFPYSVAVNRSSINITEAMDLARFYVESSEFWTPAVFLEGSLTILAETGAEEEDLEDDVLVSALRQDRVNILSVVSLYSSQVLAFGLAEGLENAAYFLREVTNVEEPADLTQDQREIALLTVENLLQSVDLMSDLAVMHLLVTLENLQALVIGANLTEERPFSAQRIETAALALAERTLKDAVPDEKPNELIGESDFSLISQRVSAQTANRGSTITSTFGTSFTFVREIEDGEARDIIGFYSSLPTYFGNLTTGVFAVEFRLASSGEIEDIESSPSPFILAFPEMYGSDTNVCQFYDTGRREWISNFDPNSGLRFLGNSTNVDGERTVLCESNHLTAFSGASLFSDSVEEVPLQFSVSDPLMILTFVMLALFLLVLLILILIESYNKIDYMTASRRFWYKSSRLNNILVTQFRDWPQFSEFLRWKFCNSHAWTSVLLCHPGDYLTQSKRWFTLGTTLFISAVMGALINSNIVPEIVDFVLEALIVSLITLPLPFLIGKMFERKSPKIFNLHFVWPELTTTQKVLSTVLKVTSAAGINLAPRDMSLSSMGLSSKKFQAMERPVDPEEGDVVRMGQVVQQCNINNGEQSAGMDADTIITNILYGEEAAQVVEKKQNKQARRFRRQLQTTFCGCKQTLKSNRELVWTDRISFGVLFSFIMASCGALVYFSLKDDSGDALIMILLAWAFDLVIRTALCIFISVVALLPICRLPKTRRIGLADGIVITFTIENLGFSFQNKIITAVKRDSQASKKQVGVGWRILAVNERDVGSDTAIQLRLQHACLSDNLIRIRFAPVRSETPGTEAKLEKISRWVHTPQKLPNFSASEREKKHDRPGSSASDLENKQHAGEQFHTVSYSAAAIVSELSERVSDNNSASKGTIPGGGESEHRTSVSSRVPIQALEGFLRQGNSSRLFVSGAPSRNSTLFNGENHRSHRAMGTGRIASDIQLAPSVLEAVPFYEDDNMTADNQDVRSPPTS